MLLLTVDSCVSALVVVTVFTVDVSDIKRFFGRGAFCTLNLEKYRGSERVGENRGNQLGNRILICHDRLRKWCLRSQR